MSERTNQMNEVLSSWKRLFDHYNTLNLTFRETPDHTLYLNDTTVIPVSHAELSGAHISISHIRFFFSSGERFVLIIHWTEDLGPRLDSTLFLRRQPAVRPIYSFYPLRKYLWILPPRRRAPQSQPRTGTAETWQTIGIMTATK